MPFTQFGGDLLECAFVDFVIFLRGRHWNRLHSFEDHAQHWNLEDRALHDEADRSAACGRDHDRIDIADVIADQKRGSVFGDALEILGSQSVHDVDQKPCDESQQKLGDQRVDVDRDEGVEDSRGEQQLWNRQARMQCQGAEDGGCDHEQRIEDAVGADHSGDRIATRTLLDECVQRHDEKAAEQTHESQVEQHSRNSRLLHQFSDRERRRSERGRCGEVQIDCECRETDRAERHQPDLDLVTGQAFAEQRTCAHARREHEQQQRDRVFITAQDIA